MLAQNGRHVLFPEKAGMEWRGSELIPISVESWLHDSRTMIVSLQRVVEYTGQFSIVSGQICASFNHFSVCMQHLKTTGARDQTQLVKCLPGKCKKLSWVFCTHVKTGHGVHPSKSQN